MGLWGAAQAIAFGLGGFAGTVAIDVTRWVFDAPALAYAVVFGAEAAMFLVAAVLAARVALPKSSRARRHGPRLAQTYAAQIGGR